MSEEAKSAAPQAMLQVPIMNWEAFAELSGIEPGVLRGHLDRGHIPSLQLGRHRYVNLAKLYRLCLEEAAP